jgi:hypothetical protein
MPEIARAMNEGVDLLPRSLYEQCEQRNAEAICAACKEGFDDFIQELKRQMPVGGAAWRLAPGCAGGGIWRLDWISGWT